MFCGTSITLSGFYHCVQSVSLEEFKNFNNRSYLTKSGFVFLVLLSSTKTQVYLLFYRVLFVLELTFSPNSNVALLTKNGNKTKPYKKRYYVNSDFL